MTTRRGMLGQLGQYTGASKTMPQPPVRRRASLFHASIALFALAAGTAASLADPLDPAPGVVIGGSADVTVGGQAAVTAGDTTSGGESVVSGSDNVFINGKPAARAGDVTDCGAIVIGGSATVFVNGKPLAGTGDVVTACAEQ